MNEWGYEVENKILAYDYAWPSSVYEYASICLHRSFFLLFCIFNVYVCVCINFVVCGENVFEIELIMPNADAGIRIHMHANMGSIFETIFC